MKKKYLVSYKEIIHKTIEIEANSEEEAIDIASYGDRENDADIEQYDYQDYIAKEIA